MLNQNFTGLVGDGIHDDGEAIQRLLDRGQPVVYIPAPHRYYLISKPLVIHSGQELRLDKSTEIRLAPGSSCIMLTNDNHMDGNNDIVVSGGIWNMQNQLQEPNPFVTRPDIFAWEKPKPYSPDVYVGIMMRFINIKNFTFTSITFRDPVTFCIQLAKVENFTIRDIYFDFQHYNPLPHNMDGVHMDGGCKFGRITNLHGRTYDDLIAINADDDDMSPFMGPIENITIDGIYAEDCHSAVRLLSKGSVIRNISISNVYGSYYQYCIGFTKFVHLDKPDGIFRNITINGLFASKATRHSWYEKEDSLVYPIIWVERGVSLDCLSINNMYRDEVAIPVATIAIQKDASVKNLWIHNAGFKNQTGVETCLIQNSGTIGQLDLVNIETDQRILDDTGIISSISGMAIP